MPMIKHLSRHGNSLALVIDKGILEILDIDGRTPLALWTDGRCLVVTPERDPARKRRFERVLRAVNRKHGRVLRRLAE